MSGNRGRGMNPHFRGVRDPNQYTMEEALILSGWGDGLDDPEPRTFQVFGEAFLLDDPEVIESLNDDVELYRNMGYYRFSVP